MDSLGRLRTLDNFKLLASLLIVSIHTAPLSSFSETADMVVTLIIARVAVPFFLMVTGFFLLPRYIRSKADTVTRTEPAAGAGIDVNSKAGIDSAAEDKAPLIRFYKRASILYVAAILIYLPANIYAGHFAGSDGAFLFLKALFFDGTMYHLWYLPASMLGVALLYPLISRFGPGAAFVVSVALYIAGLLGDSYYGLVLESPVLSQVYNAIFAVSSYTRNGVFYAPVFLMLGAMIGRNRTETLSAQDSPALRNPSKTNAIGLIVSMSAMIIEGVAVHHTGQPRHDSMYVFLLPVMYFLFRALLASHTEKGRVHYIPMLIYLIHPMMIIALRGIAKLTGMQMLFVENSLLHYLLVCLLSLGFSAVVMKVFRSIQKAVKNER